MTDSDISVLRAAWRVVWTHLVLLRHWPRAAWNQWRLKRFAKTWDRQHGVRADQARCSEAYKRAGLEEMTQQEIDALSYDELYQRYAMGFTEVDHGCS